MQTTSGRVVEWYETCTSHKMRPLNGSPESAMSFTRRVLREKSLSVWYGVQSVAK